FSSRIRHTRLSRDWSSDVCSSDLATNTLQYGMIKQIEHFWKGLTNDRTQISALPPEQYGDRFYNFVEGVTMSAEEVHREAQRRRSEERRVGQSSRRPRRTTR